MRAQKLPKREYPSPKYLFLRHLCSVYRIEVIWSGTFDSEHTSYIYILYQELYMYTPRDMFTISVCIHIPTKGCAPQSCVYVQLGSVPEKMYPQQQRDVSLYLSYQDMCTILQFRPRVVYAVSESNSKKLPPWVLKHYSAANFRVLFLLFQRADDLIALSIFPGKAIMLQDEI